MARVGTVATKEEQIISALPLLRARARDLCGDPDRADELVQETIIRVYQNADFHGLKAPSARRLLTILGHSFRTGHPDHVGTHDVAGGFLRDFVAFPEQDRRLCFRDFEKALGALPSDEREALILTAASGFSYDDAAAICECSIGAIKSRVVRARRRLAEILELDHVDEFGSEVEFRGVRPSHSRL